MASSSDIHNWFSTLFPYRLDLIGDYAGTEHFLIDGDSLLRHALADPRIDFSQGFQLLHAVYCVERFLQSLKRRKCYFYVTFFEEHADLSIPGRAQKKDLAKWKFARETLKRHLLETVNDQIMEEGEERMAYGFDGLGDPRFAAFLEAKRPYFFMAHDGDDVDEDAAGESASVEDWRLKQVVKTYMEMGYNVALVNQVEFIDSKVFTNILESHFDASSYKVETPKVAKKELSSPAPELPESMDSNRDRLAVAAVARVLSKDADAAPLAATFLLHTAFLPYLSLAQREFRYDEASVQKAKEQTGVDAFLQELLRHATELLEDGDVLDEETESDIHDFIDGRLLLGLVMKEADVPEPVKKVFSVLAAEVGKITGTPLSIGQAKTGVVPDVQDVVEEAPAKHALLPFHNDVFDPFLEPLKITEEVPEEDVDETTDERYFWNNPNKPLVATRRPPPKPVAPVATTWKGNRMMHRAERRRIGRARRKDQQFYSQMARYAQSLSGGVLAPEKVIADPTGTNQKKKLEKEISAKEAKEKKDIKGGKKGQAPKEPKAGKELKVGKGKPAKEVKLSKAEQIKLKNAEEKAGKGAEALQKLWNGVWRELDKFKDDEAIITRLDEFQKKVAKAIPSNQLAGVSTHEGVYVETEVRLYKVMVLQNLYARYCAEEKKLDGLPTVAQIFEESRKILASKGLTVTVKNIIKTVFKCLKIEQPNVAAPSKDVPDRKLGFLTKWNGKVEGDLAVGMSSEEFQLEYFGPYMDRNMDSAPDERCSFDPDAWQRRVLDEIDGDNSVFVVAPTSAGKTFISFHAMKKVLRSDDNGVLIYVAPTKALVNQIAAEVISRFSKDYRYANAGKTVWAIHTGDYHMNKPEECQILITVPQILSTMLMSPVNAKRWTPRIKRIIYDEIHSIGNSEDGAIWEQLLLLSPCPIVALSATVGNPNELSQWLAATQSKINTKLTMVQHPYRYSDLRKFTYNPKETESYKDFKELGRLRKYGTVDTDPRIETVHPVAAVTNPANGLPDDFALEPRDCLALYRAMVAVQTEKYPVPATLDYKKAFGTEGNVIKKADVIVWEADLKSQLRKWMKDPRAPFMAVVRKLGGGRKLSEERKLIGINASQALTDPEIAKVTEAETKETSASTEVVAGGHGEDEYMDLDPIRTAYLRDKTLPLLQHLHQSNALPAILFSYDRLLCEFLGRHLVSQLKNAEAEWRKVDPKWKSTMKQWEAYMANKKKAGKFKAPKLTNQRGENGEKGEGFSKADLAREAAESEGNSLLESFNPEDPSIEFSFADFKKHTKADLETDLQHFPRWNMDPFFLEGLKRGIGIHHSGLNRRYRQAVEMLFRKGYLRVIISTETLALGINMPCKTVVFAGDNVHLTALNYRQAAGRAGRRGFDLLGNVIFHGVTQEKVHRLISSRLPSLMGHFPISNSLVLRLCMLLHNSEKAEFAQKAIASLLSQKNLMIGEESVPAQVLTHLRFSIELLRRQHLIDASGAPMNFATITSHMHYMEPSAFAFHTLLASGYLGEVCADFNKNPAPVIENLMLIFSHIFGRIPCSKHSGIKPLPPLPKKAEQILERENQTSLEIYSTYAQTFADRFCKNSKLDRQLPFSKVHCGGNGIPAVITKNKTPTNARSHFYALSGHTDKFSSIDDLASSARDSITVDGSAIPHIPRGENLNSYLLEFFHNGDLVKLTTEHRIRPGNRWFLLKEFSDALTIIIAGLTVYLRDGPGAWYDPSKLSGDEEGGELDAAKIAAEGKGVAVDEDEDIGEEEDEAADVEEGLKSGLERTKAPEELVRVFLAIRQLQVEFEEKFRAVYA